MGSPRLLHGSKTGPVGLAVVYPLTLSSAGPLDTAAEAVLSRPLSLCRATGQAPGALSWRMVSGALAPLPGGSDSPVSISPLCQVYHTVV